MNEKAPPGVVVLFEVGVGSELLLLLLSLLLLLGREKEEKEGNIGY